MQTIKNFETRKISQHLKYLCSTKKLVSARPMSIVSLEQSSFVLDEEQLDQRDALLFSPAEGEIQRNLEIAPPMTTGSKQNTGISRLANSGLAGNRKSRIQKAAKERTKRTCNVCARHSSTGTCRIISRRSSKALERRTSRVSRKRVISTR